MESKRFLEDFRRADEKEQFQTIPHMSVKSKKYWRKLGLLYE